MKSVIKFVSLPSAFALILLISSCNLNQNDNSSKKELNLASRASEDYRYPRMYYYKTIASFVNGESIDRVPLGLENKQVSIVVLYDTDAPWAEHFEDNKAVDETGDHIFNKILTKQDLTIQHQFQLDGYNECLILDLNTPVESVTEVCKEISTIAHVIAVDIKEWPKQHTPVGVTASK